MRRLLVSDARARSSCCRALLACAVSLLGACQLRDDLIATRLDSTTGGSSSGGSGAAASAGSSSETCPGFVPSVGSLVPGGSSQDICAGWLARRAFAHSVCSCSDLNVLAVLASDVRDSSEEGTSADPGAAAIGVNGNYSGGEYVRIGGSLTVAGTAPFTSRGGIDVAADLRLAAAADASGPIFVGRDAWLLAAASSLSLATVRRDLHLGPSGSLEGPVPVIAGGATLHEVFDIVPPCACADEELIDVAGLVSQGMTRNDNSRLGLQLDALMGAASATEVALSCGRFALRAISADAPVTLRIAGRVLLFVAGDVEAGKRFSLQLEPGAELDWFIGGNLSVSGESLVGDEDRPAATRIYVAGSRDVALPGTARFSANLYAPRAHALIGALGDVYGSVFGAAVTSLGPLLSHYDRAVLWADDRCAVATPTRCDSCDQCGTRQTCVAGACAACTADRDCCFPLVCQAGSCQAFNAD
jgi:hypothetical protein